MLLSRERADLQGARSVPRAQRGNPWQDAPMGQFWQGVTSAVVAGLLLAALIGGWRLAMNRHRASRELRWRIVPQVSGDRTAVHVRAEWVKNDTATDAKLSPMSQVRVTSTGGSSRQVLRLDESVEAIFRWDENCLTPKARLEWSERTGKRHVREIDLRSIADTRQ